VSYVWDTTIASKIAPNSAREREVRERAAADPVVIAAPTLSEITYGLLSKGRRDERFTLQFRWLQHEIIRADLIEALAMDADAATVFGRLRAFHPTPPTGGRRRTGSRGDQRVGWILDLQIAACAWVHGYGVMTENLRDFVEIRDHLQRMFPEGAPLDVVGA